MSDNNKFGEIRTLEARPGDDVNTIHRLLEENRKLRHELELVVKINDKIGIELEALKPKPIVEVFYESVGIIDIEGSERTTHYKYKPKDVNLKLTFENGKLFSAEVLK